jgi:hypothetical protein
MKTVKLLPLVGERAENKEIAKQLREDVLVPAIQGGEELVIDFSGVRTATQSFVHALISDLFRKFGSDVLDDISFKQCTVKVQKVIETVTTYMQAAE